MRAVVLRDGAWTVEDVDPAAVRPGRGLQWVRAGGATPEGLAALGERLGLHPLALEDVQNPRQRPKVEDYGETLFVVVRVPAWDGGDLAWRQVGLFLGPDWLVTASSAPLPELDEVQERVLRRGLPEDRDTACFLLYRVLDALVDAWFPFMDALEERLEDLEDEVVDRASTESLAAIRDVKRTVATTRKVSSPMREAALSLERGDHAAVREATRVYLRDVSDHVVRIAERLEHVRETTLIAQEAWNSTLANRQNETMKRLTVIAALLLVPSLLAGLGGMNFPGLPAWPFWSVVGTIVAAVALGFVVAAWRDWL